MSTYFTLTTTVINAIDNVTIHGYAIYEPTDVLRLITAHARYPFTLTFSNKRSEELECHCLKESLNLLDNMVLHKEVVEHVPGDRKVLGELITEYKEGSQDAKYIYLDLSDDREFKDLKRDRSAMVAENRRVGKVIQFLFKLGVEFEYDGSRAKLKIQKDYFEHIDTKFSRVYNARVYKECKLVVTGYEYHEVTKIVEVKPLNNE